MVDSETDALLLRIRSSKPLQPRYNILLKDDKTYPWIVVRREPFPACSPRASCCATARSISGPIRRSACSAACSNSSARWCRCVRAKLNLAPEAIARGRYSVCLPIPPGEL